MSNGQNSEEEKFKNEASKNEYENEHFSGEIYSLEMETANPNDLQFLNACELFFEKLLSNPHDELIQATQFARLESNYKLPASAACTRLYEDIGYALEYFKFLQFPFEIVDLYPDLSKTEKLSLLHENLSMLKLDANSSLTIILFKKKLAFIEVEGRYINVDELGQHEGRYFYREKHLDNYFVSHLEWHNPVEKEITYRISLEEYLRLSDQKNF